MDVSARWGRKKHLRGLYPHLTEAEALVLRAMQEGDESYLAHMSQEERATAFMSLAEKGHVDSGFFSGACRDRTGDLRLAKPALSQLS